MPNGKIHDNPITDLTIHGLHPFPQEMEELILRIHSLKPSALRDLGWDPFGWEKGKNLEEGMAKLQRILKRTEQGTD